MCPCFLQVPNAWELLLVEDVVDCTVKTLLRLGELPTDKLKSLPAICVGLDGQRDNILHRLAAAQGTSTMVLLCGMGGIGKSALARAVFNQLHKDNRTVPCSFVELVHPCSVPDLVRMQQDILCDLANLHNARTHYKWSAADDGHKVLLEKLRHKRVLLVVDNVWEDQLELLLPKGIMEVLAEGSVVLVTSRHSDAVAQFDGTPALHNVEYLSEQDSLELFCRHACASSSRAIDEAEAVASVVAMCGGMPVVLEALARCGGLPATVQALGKHINLTDGTPLDRIDELLRGAYSSRGGVFHAIKESWDTLIDPEEQETLLDIVWFLNGQHRSRVGSYCWSAVLDKLERQGLVQLRIGADGSREVTVHEAVSDFCKMHFEARPEERKDLQAPDDDLLDEQVQPVNICFM
jgi:hypothetical protein